MESQGDALRVETQEVLDGIAAYHGVEPTAGIRAALSDAYDAGRAITNVELVAAHERLLACHLVGLPLDSRTGKPQWCQCGACAQSAEAKAKVAGAKGRRARRAKPQ